jgi:hypothetical protein
MNKSHFFLLLLAIEDIVSCDYRAPSSSGPGSCGADALNLVLPVFNEWQVMSISISQGKQGFR